MAVWVLGGVLALLGALALAEVAVLFPRAGGNYVFLREGYGRMAGFLWGWVEFWIIRSASIAALATMFTESFHDVLKQSLYPGDKSVEVLAVLAAATAHGAGHRRAGGGQRPRHAARRRTAVRHHHREGRVAAVHHRAAVRGLRGGVATPTYPPKVEHLRPTWPASWLGVNWSLFGAALVGVLWAYHGWMNIAPIAEEVKNPQRNIPLALLAGVLILIVLYCGANCRLLPRHPPRRR